MGTRRGHREALNFDLAEFYLTTEHDLHWAKLGFVDHKGWVPRAVSFSAGFRCAAPNHPTCLPKPRRACMQPYAGRRRQVSQRIVDDMAEHNRINHGHCPAFRLGLGLLTASFHVPVTLVPPDWIFPRQGAEFCLMRYVEGAY